MHNFREVGLDGASGVLLDPAVRAVRGTARGLEEPRGRTSGRTRRSKLIGRHRPVVRNPPCSHCYPISWSSMRRGQSGPADRSLPTIVDADRTAPTPRWTVSKSLRPRTYPNLGRGPASDGVQWRLPTEPIRIRIQFLQPRRAGYDRTMTIDAAKAGERHLAWPRIRRIVVV